MAVEFGVLIPTREAVMSNRPEAAPLLAMAERAEAAGFDSVWIGDSLTARPRHEPLTLMAAIARRTRRARLRTRGLLPRLPRPPHPRRAPAHRRHARPRGRGPRHPRRRLRRGQSADPQGIRRRRRAVRPESGAIPRDDRDLPGALAA